MTNLFNERMAGVARIRRQRIAKLKGRGLKPKQIALLLKISRQRVEQILAKGLK